MEKLRQGRPVEIEKGKIARLNPKTKSLEFSTGERRSVANDPEFFPQNEEQLAQARALEKEEENVSKYPLGEFGYQAAQSGILGGAQDWVSYLTSKGDDYTRKKLAQAQVSERISEESPVKSALAHGASIGADLLLTRGMSGLAAGGTIAGASAGSRILTEPADVAVEAGIGAAGGKILDIGANYVNKIAARRGLSRQTAQSAENVRKTNIAGQEAADLANKQAVQDYNVLKTNTKIQNEAALRQAKADLQARQQAIIAGKNAETQAIAARDAEIFQRKQELQTARTIRSSETNRLEAEYQQSLMQHNAQVNQIKAQNQLAEKQYQQALKDLPHMQQKAQQEYSANVVRNAEALQKNFPKDTKIFSDQFGVNEFIEDSIEKTALAGSREATQASRILKSIFPEGEILTGKDLAKRYKALEGVIERSPPELQAVLSSYKEEMSRRLPKILADTTAYRKIVPNLEKNLGKSIQRYLGEVKVPPYQAKIIEKNMQDSLKQTIREITPQNFIQKVQNGELAAEIEANLSSNVDALLGEIKSGPSSKYALSYQDAQKYHVHREYDYVLGNLKQDLDKLISKADLKVVGAEANALKKLGGNLKATLGTAEPVAPPSAPIRSEFPQAPLPPSPVPEAIPAPLPPPVAPYIEPPMPAAPQLAPTPAAPTLQNFVPTPEPTLPGAQNFAERIGDRLEQPMSDMLKSRSLVDNPLAKLYLLKQLLGKAAVPAEAAALGGYGALKGLTSPGAAGTAVRGSFKQMGIAAIDALAQKYPSYHEGVLDNPQERRSLTREVEDDQEIPATDKAIIQSKINRGKPILGRLE